jgi:hypothetical protein
MMAYEEKNLSVLAYSNGFTLWHYKTHDQQEAKTSEQRGIEDQGYFDEAAGMLRKGDMIDTNFSANDDIGGARYLVKSSSDDKVVVTRMCSTEQSSKESYVCGNVAE